MLRNKKNTMQGKSMLALIVVFALGIVVGAGGLYAYAAYQAQHLLSTGKTTLNTSPSTQNMTPAVTTPPGAAGNLQQRLFQQGITITDTVTAVYPGLGFMIKDTNGTQMFVLWKGTAPVVGEQVKVEGPLASAKQDMSTLQSLPGFTSQLQSFLQSQPVYLKATQVQPSSGSSAFVTPTP